MLELVGRKLPSMSSNYHATETKRIRLRLCRTACDVIVLKVERNECSVCEVDNGLGIVGGV